MANGAIEISRRNRDNKSETIPIEYDFFKKENIVTLNLRGTIFQTRHGIFEHLPESCLNQVISSSDQEDLGGEFFFDRNPTIFHAILDYYSTGHLHVPSGVCVENLRDELLFWGIEESSVSKCCWRRMNKTKEYVAIHDELAKLENTADSQNYNQGLRFRVWRFLNRPNSSLLAKMWFFFIIILAVSSVVVYGLADVITVPRPVEEIPTYNFSDNKVQEILQRKAHPVLIWIEMVTNTLFLFDITLRLCFAPCIKTFLLNYISIFEFLSVMSSYVNMYAYNNLDILRNKIVYWTTYVFSIFFIGRVLRILRLARHYREMAILGLCFKASKRELGFLALSFLAFSLIFATLMFHAEGDSPKFPNLFVCYWWSVITMTTVGYGDQIPDTVPGYCVAILTAVFGILILSMPIAIMSSTFNQYYKCFKFQKGYLQQKKNGKE